MGRVDYINLPEDFKFSEEIFIINDDIKLDDDFKYDISYRSYKKCKESQNNPILKDSTICKSCYYKDFFEKMINIRKSKRKEFLKYQLDLRENKTKFLDELRDFLLDLENDFEKQDYSIQSEYLEILDVLKGEVLNVVSESRVYNSSNLNILSESKNNNELELDIFISHSSKNRNIAEMLIDLISNSFSLSDKSIRCTSVNGYKLKGGVNTDETLRAEINNSKVFIGILSEDSLNSTYVLFELGARWGLKLPFKLIVLNSETFSLLKDPIKNYHICNFSDRGDLIQLLEEIGEIIEKPLRQASVYNRILDKILSE